MGQILRLGLKSLLLHKLRSMLAVLGIMIGIAAMISMVTIGEGSKQEALEQIKRLGATNIIVRSEKPPEDSSASAQRRSILEYGLTQYDLNRFAAIPTVTRILPIRMFPFEVRYLAERHNGRIVGTSPAYAPVNQVRLARGRFLTDVDYQQFKNVCVIGARVADQLFGYEDPLGKAVKVNNHYFTVVGVSSFRVPSAGAGGSQAAENFNDDVYIPLSTCRARLGDTIVNRQSGTFSAERVELTQITMTLASTDDVRPTAQIVQNLLEKYHKQTDWAMTVPLDLLEEAERTKMLFNILLGSIASISLLVGGIGIMNIMLATVTERTREIGIRRALGAKRRHIIWQFLTEAVLLTGIGGAIGVFLGLVAPEGIRLVALEFF